MAHSNEMRQFQITHEGVKLADAAIDASGIYGDAPRAARDAGEPVRVAMNRGTPERNRPAAPKRRG
jgi:hypothetical protein